MVTEDGVAEPPAIVGWSKALGELHRRIDHRFARSEARGRVKGYLVDPLGRVERKNGWQLAEAIGERDPQGVQRLLSSAKWEADEVREDLREYVAENLADEETGILIVDVFAASSRRARRAWERPASTRTPPATRSTARSGCSYPTPEHFLAPSLGEGQVVVIDNLGAHRARRIREFIEARGQGRCSCRPTRRT